jgi:hypothetical protein
LVSRFGIQLSGFVHPVAERYCGEITVGALRNWRALRIGPSFFKIRKAVLYPLGALDAWDQAHTVECEPSRSERRVGSPR